VADPPGWPPDFHDLIAALDAAHVDFLVVGAHALAAHGVVRGTGDLDVFVRPDPKNAQRRIQALRNFGVLLCAHGIRPEDFTQPGAVYQLGLPPRRIDILTELAGLSYEDAAADTKRTAVGHLQFRVPSIRALIRNKRATARPRDLEDARLPETLLRTPHRDP